LRSWIASAVQSPVLKFPFLGPRGAPGLSPPCSRHLVRPRTEGFDTLDLKEAKALLDELHA
jgi:hypothetical protein